MFTDRHQLFVYPIKSLRGSSISHAEILPTGFAYDRTFMLLKAENGELKNMQVSKYPEMCLFTTSIKEKGRWSEVVVSYMDPANPSAPKRRLQVPLVPDTDDLKLVEVNMYGSKTEAYDMGAHFDDWFSSCFDYPVVLAYIGNYRRPVLGNLPSARSSFSSLKGASAPPSSAASPLDHVAAFWAWLCALVLALFRPKTPEPAGITFADLAPLLTVTTASLADAESRLPETSLPLDVTKFRPNILVSGSKTAWDEDFWAHISFRSAAAAANEKPSAPVDVEMTANCGRCVSLNVDYETGKFVDEKAAVLKRLMKDRRIDKGMKYSPIFGRYGFPRSLGTITVGDEVRVEKRNSEQTVFRELACSLCHSANSVTFCGGQV